VIKKLTEKCHCTCIDININIHGQIMTNWLPDEIMPQIFMHLVDPNDWMSFMLVRRNNLSRMWFIYQDRMFKVARWSKNIVKCVPRSWFRSHNSQVIQNSGYVIITAPHIIDIHSRFILCCMVSGRFIAYAEISYTGQRIMWNDQKILELLGRVNDKTLGEVKYLLSIGEPIHPFAQDTRDSANTAKMNLLIKLIDLYDGIQEERFGQNYSKMPVHSIYHHDDPSWRKKSANAVASYDPGVIINKMKSTVSTPISGRCKITIKSYERYLKFIGILDSGTFLRTFIDMIKVPEQENPIESEGEELYVAFPYNKCCYCHLENCPSKCDYKLNEFFTIEAFNGRVLSDAEPDFNMDLPDPGPDFGLDSDSDWEDTLIDPHDHILINEWGSDD